LIARMFRFRRGGGLVAARRVFVVELPACVSI